MLEQIIQSYTGVRIQLRLTLGSGTSISNRTGFTLVFECHKRIASLWHLSQTSNFYWSRWSSFFNLTTFIIDHRTYTSEAVTCYKGIADFQRTVLNEYTSNWSTGFIKLSFYNSTACPFVRVRFVLINFSYEQDHFQQFFQVNTLFRREVNEDGISTPLFRNKFITCKLLLHLIRICTRFVDFINSDNNRKSSSLSVCNSFNGLRHNTVISSNYDNCHIRNLCTTSTHSSKCFVTRCIKERDFLLIDFDLISTDVLSDSAGFA
ncbi:hypothetical protein D3C75_615350 [compost metagenome]